MRGKLSRSIAINNVYHRRGRSTATWVFTSPPPSFFPHHFHLFSIRFFLTLHKICRMVAVYLSRQERDLKSSCRCIHRTWNAATSKRFCSSQSVRVCHPLVVPFFLASLLYRQRSLRAKSKLGLLWYISCSLACYGVQRMPGHLGTAVEPGIGSALKSLNCFCFLDDFQRVSKPPILQKGTLAVLTFC